MLRRKDGSTLRVRVVGKAIDPEQPNEGSIWNYADITAELAARDALERAVAERTVELQAANRRLEDEIAERKEAESRAQHLADHDALTGLPNRRLLEDRLRQALALSQRSRKQTAVMFVDLDRFKIINDSLGHAIGDVLLKEIADRLVRQLRVGDTICRMGGDEFVVVLPDVKRSSDVANVAQKIIETVSQPVQADERELQVSASVGISVFPDDGRDAETLIRNADAAMYHAKEIGRSNYQFFTEQMNLAASRRLALENELRRALRAGELRLLLQPVFAMASGALAGFEALLRWQHPAKGTLAPAEFLQLAEDSGLMQPIGEFTLREVCRRIASPGERRALPVSVNLSARQFGDPRLAETIARALKDSAAPAHLLELEIAEPTATQQPDVALATLCKLKELGVALTIDDFGAAHSNFGALKRFPVGKLKIGRSLIAETASDKDARSIVAGMIGLGHAIGLKVVAVGVESEAQREFLKSCGCDFAQGLLLGAPADAHDASGHPA
jgi:diguanylate cyclase (GGDEF)-like protein